MARPSLIPAPDFGLQSPMPGLFDVLLDHIAISDVAFRAWGSSVEEVFVAAADAVMNAMVEDLESIENRVRRPTDVQETEIGMPLFEFFQELIFLKDAERLLLRVSELGIKRGGQNLHPSCGGVGRVPNGAG